MTLSIIIVTFNARADLERCLGSLVTAPPRVDHEVLVVDNASTDGAANVVERQFPSVRLLRASSNLGFSRGNNLGIRESTGSLILLLNPDTIVPEGAVDRLCERLQARPRAAAIGPRLVDLDGRAEISFGPMRGAIGEAWQKALGALYARGVGAVVRRVDARTRAERSVAWVSGACLLVRRADAERAGLIDERFFLYWEDVDFCASLRALGRDVLFSPVAEVVHARGRSAAGSRARVNEAYRRGQLAFYAKHHPAWVGPLRLFLRLTGRLPGPDPGL